MEIVSTDPIPKVRIHSIDILRGIIMVVMALDHTRDFFSFAQFDPLDLTKTSIAYFFTRWITHLCAPTFVFLSGTSAYLSLSRKQSKKEASGFLLKRGLWLLVLELTIIGFGWQFDWGFHVVIAQVIWAIGWSMILLSALVYLRPLHVGIIGLVIIFGHNALDAVKSDAFGQFKFIWMFLHEQNFYQVNHYESILFLYPVIPWVGVMAAGYAFGTLFKQFHPDNRQKLFIQIGLSCLILFAILRGFNIYGDPFPWQRYGWWMFDVMAIIKCQKYPPSLAYLLVTLGVSITSLGLLEKVKNRVTDVFTAFGRVPLFYYVLHIYLLHIAVIVAGWIKGVQVKGSFGFPGMGGNGFNLFTVYLIWLSAVIILYFPCRWFMQLKQRRSDWWLSYL